MNTQVDMTGKTVMITGATRGIGKATAIALAQMGANLVLVCRNRGRAGAACQDIADHGEGDIELLVADLSSQHQIRTAVADFLSNDRLLHVLINNAGATFRNRSETEDGIESTFAINHLAPFLLTNLLLETLIESGPSRVVTVSSGTHIFGRLDFDDVNSEHNYGGLRVYGKSKLANILFTTELARRLDGTAVTVNAAHPGPVATNFGRNNDGPLRMMVRMMAPLRRSPERGAETSVYLATSSQIADITGKYFFDSKEKLPSKAARNEEDAGRLWQVSEALTSL